MLFHDYHDIVKSFGQLYHYLPCEIMDLTIAEVWTLIPEEVEKAIAAQRGENRQQEQLTAALISLQKQTGRTSFSSDEVNFEIMRLYGRSSK